MEKYLEMVGLAWLKVEPKTHPLVLALRTGSSSPKMAQNFDLKSALPYARMQPKIAPQKLKIFRTLHHTNPWAPKEGF